MFDFPIELVDCNIAWIAFEVLWRKIKQFSQIARYSDVLFLEGFDFLEIIRLNDHGSGVMQNNHVFEV